MKFHFAAVFCLPVFLSNSLRAQTQQHLNIDEATVFLSGAELFSSAHLNLAKGENEILFTNVAGDVNSQSLSVAATNGVAVESATFENNYLTTEVYSPRVKEIKDSIEALAEDTTMLHNKIAVLGRQVGILWQNTQVGGQNTGLNVAEVNKYLDLIGSRMEGFMDQQAKEKQKMKKVVEHMQKLGRQLEEEQKRGYQPGGQLLVKFYAKEATASDIKINYVVPHAGWSPTYDIWADDASSPIKLYYKANIYQNSGVKWNNVHLSLSTGNPNEGAQAPVLSPWYLAFYAPQTYQWNNQAPAANYMRSQGDAMGVAGGGLENRAEEKQSSMNNYVSVDNSGINTTFDIDLPYTIPSDGKQHLVAIKKYELPATYRYYAVPKLDKDAFLQAQITNWEDLNLLPGQSNIFYENTYVGQGMLDVRNLKDTMTISLGRDKKIVVKRERDMKLRSVKTIGTNIRESFTYTISARNTRKEPITLIVQDQLPVSNDKDISIEDVDIDGAEREETTGMLKWTLTVNSNETKKVTFGYTVKYPKGKTVSGLR